VQSLLIIEDDRDLLELLKYNFTKAGFSITCAKDAEEGLRLLTQKKPDLIILDIMLPYASGFEILRVMKQDITTSNIPVIILTARVDESDVVMGLELGADDYIKKPFSIRELIARVKAVLRRKGYEDAKIIKVGGLQIDCDKIEAKYEGKTIKLTPTEFQILKCLAQKPGKVFTRNQLLDAARGVNAFPIDRTIDVHVTSLRKKLGKAGKLILTIYGIGYKIKTDL
jgi:two-component system phosphate regulon response regulator PhoB